MNDFSWKVIFPCILTVLLQGHNAMAAPQHQGIGRVNMQGAIIDAACAIATESQEQIIDMDVVPIADIIRDGQGTERLFSIELINCVLTYPNNGLPGWKHFQVTFDGESDGKLFGVRGEAKGVALKIFDVRGNAATPGGPLPLGEISPGAMRLNYSMRLVSNSKPLHAGTYSSAVRFKLNYF
ncbi:type 1 fimbrial protein [Serratia marcescens]|uniref:fimbrial protein n=1 Tax=Serratia marcescens TaxID=615 RepID=UPI0011545DDF|nr:fimbrial protein [Serratia marcescens]QDI20300.1 type 1 fimbrial protein [Serratia marcescens]QDI30044.1 type 1 fimbrial protein [Serratia marcescens]QDI44548.1 type 1 fimbrial protein [Serratia marcescens]QDI58973.1 type 1 fimbrial protein [Serratia marcescens]QLJ67565.1 type 1 fimbrial protein [Serratia marcescens]